MDAPSLSDHFLSIFVVLWPKPWTPLLPSPPGTSFCVPRPGIFVRLMYSF